MLWKLIRICIWFGVNDTKNVTGLNRTQRAKFKYVEVCKISEHFINN